nr:MAG TPA: hypothetical protein [Caudoviricetes sp.]
MYKYSVFYPFLVATFIYYNILLLHSSQNVKCNTNVIIKYLSVFNVLFFVCLSFIYALVLYIYLIIKFI